MDVFSLPQGARWELQQGQVVQAPVASGKFSSIKSWVKGSGRLAPLFQRMLTQLQPLPLAGPEDFRILQTLAYKTLSLCTSFYTKAGWAAKQIGGHGEVALAQEALRNGAYVKMYNALYEGIYAIVAEGFTEKHRLDVDKVLMLLEEGAVSAQITLPLLLLKSRFTEEVDFERFLRNAAGHGFVNAHCLLAQHFRAKEPADFDAAIRNDEIAAAAGVRPSRIRLLRDFADGRYGHGDDEAARVRKHAVAISECSSRTLSSVDRKLARDVITLLDCFASPPGDVTRQQLEVCEGICGDKRWKGFLTEWTNTHQHAVAWYVRGRVLKYSNREAAEACLERAVEKGFAPARYELGCLLLLGKDPYGVKAGHALIEQAAGDGDPRALLLRAKWFTRPSTTERAHDLLLRVLRTENLDERTFKEAVQLFFAVAPLVDVIYILREDHIDLLDMYGGQEAFAPVHLLKQQQYGVAKGAPEVDGADVAAEEQRIWSQLAMLYAARYGAQSDVPGSVIARCHHKSEICARMVSRGQNLLAEDSHLAMWLFDRAAALGSSEALYYLRQLHKMGIRNDDVVVVDDGNLDPCLHYLAGVEALDSDDTDGAAQNFARAAKQGEPRALVRLMALDDAGQLPPGLLTGRELVEMRQNLQDLRTKGLDSLIEELSQPVDRVVDHDRQELLQLLCPGGLEAEQQRKIEEAEAFVTRKKGETAFFAIDDAEYAFIIDYVRRDARQRLLGEASEENGLESAARGAHTEFDTLSVAAREEYQEKVDVIRDDFPAYVNQVIGDHHALDEITLEEARDVAQAGGDGFEYLVDSMESAVKGGSEATRASRVAKVEAALEAAKAARPEGNIKAIMLRFADWLGETTLGAGSIRLDSKKLLPYKLEGRRQHYLKLLRSVTQEVAVSDLSQAQKRSHCAHIGQELLRVFTAERREDVMSPFFVELDGRQMYSMSPQMQVELPLLASSVRDGFDAVVYLHNPGSPPELALEERFNIHREDEKVWLGHLEQRKRYAVDPGDFFGPRHGELIQALACYMYTGDDDKQLPVFNAAVLSAVHREHLLGAAQQEYVVDTAQGIAQLMNANFKLEINCNDSATLTVPVLCLAHLIGSYTPEQANTINLEDLRADFLRIVFDQYSQYRPAGDFSTVWLGQILSDDGFALRILHAMREGRDTKLYTAVTQPADVGVAAGVGLEEEEEE